MSTQQQTQRRELARGGSLSFIGSAFSAGMGFVLTVIVSRLLGTEGAGLFFQITGIFAMVLAFAKFGMDSTSIYLIPRVKLDDSRKVRSAVAACILTALGVSVLLLAAVEIAAPMLWAESSPALLRGVQAIMVFLPMGAVMLTVSAVLRALGSVREFVWISNLALPLLRAIFVVIAFVITGSVAVVSVAWAVPFAVLVLIAGVMVSRHISVLEQGTPGPRLPAMQQYREIWRFAIPRTISAGLEQALTWVDVLIIGWLMSDQAAGIYGGAARFIQAGLLVDAALRVVVSPRFSALLHKGKRDEVSDLYVTASVWLVLTASPAYVLLGVFSPVFLSLLGPEFSEGAVPLSILAVGMAVTFLAGNIHSLLIMSGRSGWAAVNKAIVLTVNVVGNFALIPLFGLQGAAFVWMVCMLLDAALATAQVRFFLGVAMQPWEVLRPLAIVVVSFGMPALVAVQFLGNSVLALLTSGGVGVGLFLVLCVWQKRQLRLDGLLSILRSRT